MNKVGKGYVGSTVVGLCWKVCGAKLLRNPQFLMDCNKTRINWHQDLVWMFSAHCLWDLIHNMHSSVPWDICVGI